MSYTQRRPDLSTENNEDYNTPDPVEVGIKWKTYEI
jgi:hypothetical protein